MLLFLGEIWYNIHILKGKGLRSMKKFNQMTEKQMSKTDGGLISALIAIAVVGAGVGGVIGGTQNK